MANKRLLSVLIASAMSLSYVTANAVTLDYEMDGSDVIITTALDEAAAVAAKGADVHVNVEKKTTVDADVEALGRTWKNYVNKATADVYKVVFTVNNFGTLINGYDETDSAYFAFYDMTINYGVDDAVVNLASPKATLPDASGKTIIPTIGKTASAINLILPVSTNNTKDTVWPGANTVVDSGDIVAETYIAVTPGSAITLKPGTASKINYAVESQDIGVKAGIWTNTNITLDDIVLGETKVTPVITVKPDTAEMILGNTVELVASNDQDAKLTYTYKSSNDKIATVDVNGVVKAVGEGPATITVSAEGATSAECTINVRKATVGEDFTPTELGKKIKFIGMELLGVDSSNKYVYITKDGKETRKYDKTIGEILGGVWGKGTSVEGSIAIGIITADESSVFSFEIK